MLQRVLEPEVMDSAEEARDYDAMDHSQVNRLFVADFLAAWTGKGSVIDIGTGTAQIPIELCRQSEGLAVVAVDLASHMLSLAHDNVRRAGLEKRITLRLIDAKQLPFADQSFSAVISNSIIHHIPQPAQVLAAMKRVTKIGGMLFVRDLLRPADEAAVQGLVDRYAGQANAHQRQMFADSLRAALALPEVRQLVGALGFQPSSVNQTSDRHWTWSAIRE